MKYTLLKILLPAIMLLSTAVSAGLYKGLDDEGNVVYSDKPFDNSEKYIAPPITIMDAPKIQPKEVKKEEKEDVFKYTKLSIIAPKNQQTIWNEPNLIVSIQVRPALNIAAGHTVWLLMDGKPLVKKSRSLSLPIGRADRGEHKLQVQVRDKKGKILKRSKTITVHIKNTVVPRRSPR